MSYEAVRKEIQAHFASNFDGVTSDKIAWDNVSFTPEEGESWVRFSVQNNLSNYVSIGGPSVKVRKFGIVFVQIFVPQGQGTLAADQIVDKVSNVLEAEQLSSGCTLQETSVQNVGNINGWYQVNTSTPFYYDEIRALN